MRTTSNISTLNYMKPITKPLSAFWPNKRHREAAMMLSLSCSKALLIVWLVISILPGRLTGQNGSIDTISREEYALISRFADNADALKRAKACIDTAIYYGNYLTNITSEQLVKLPIVVVHKQINNTQYSLGVNKVSIFPNYIQVEAFARITTPNGKEIYFGSPDIKFSGSGGIVGDVRLGLLQDFQFDIIHDKARVTLHKIGSESGCFVSFDCDGFKEFAMDADVELSRDWVLPVDQDGTPKVDGKVKAHFMAKVKDFNDWFVKLHLPNFTLTAYKSVAVSVEEAIIDFSDTYNDPDMIFPPDYFEEPGDGTEAQDMGQEQLLGMTQGISGSSDGRDNSFGQSGNNSGVSSGGNTGGGSSQNSTMMAWRGFYIRTFKLTLPKEISKRDTNERITVFAKNLLIDSRGLSGSCGVENVLTLKEGRMQKWAYSLDKIEISFVKSKLYAFYMNGKLEVPIADEEETLSYNGSYNHRQGNFSLSVGLDNTITFPIWRVVEVSLTKGSYVNISVINRKFYPFACLSGMMSIKSGGSQNTADLDAPSIIFEELKLGTIAPYINIKALSLSKEVKLRGTPISITQIGIVSKGKLIGPMMGASVNMDEEKDNGIEASLSVAVLGTISERGGKQKFEYEKTEIKDGSLSAKFPCFEFAGSIIPFNGNAKFGTGFQASLKIAVNMKGEKKSDGSESKSFSFSADAFGIFGNLETYRYWAVDANVDFTPGIVLSGVTLTGFSGGAYKHMMMTANGGKPGTLGVSNSGNIYDPNPEVTLGLRAGVRMQFSGPKSLSGSAMLQFEFSGNGLQKIFTEGTVELQIPMDQVPGLGKVVENIARSAKPSVEDMVTGFRNDNKAKIDSNCSNTAKAVFWMDLNFTEKRYLATLDFTIAMYNEFLVGGGHSEILADFKNNKFHFYLGTFAAPINLHAGIGSSKVEANVYLMFGNDIPGFPPINPQVVSLLKISPNQRQADVNKNMQYVANGAGMLLGANVQVDINECKWVICNIRTKCSVVVGFDAGFLKFDEAKRCNNGEGLGINGWYNMARFYLALGVEVGRHRKCSKDYHHWANLTIGALLEGQFPNPVYIQGRVYINVCGISFSVDYKKGERCL